MLECSHNAWKIEIRTFLFSFLRINNRSTRELCETVVAHRCQLLLCEIIFHFLSLLFIESLFFFFPDVAVVDTKVSAVFCLCTAQCLMSYWQWHQRSPYKKFWEPREPTPENLRILLFIRSWRSFRAIEWFDEYEWIWNSPSYGASHRTTWWTYVCHNFTTYRLWMTTYWRQLYVCHSFLEVRVISSMVEGDRRRSISAFQLVDDTNETIESIFVLSRV